MPSNKRYTLIQKQYRKRYLALQKKLEKEYGSISGKLMGSIQKLAFYYAGEDGRLPKAKLRKMQMELSKMNYQYSKELKKLIDTNVVTSANIAIHGQDEAAGSYVKALIKETSGDDKKILKKALINPKSGVFLGTYGAGLAKTVRKAVWEKRWQDGHRLSDRIWKLHSTMDTNLKSMVEQCVNQGKSAVNFSKAVERYLEKPGPAWTTAIKPSITGGSVKYNALRLARTETNNAYRMAHQASAKQSVIVKGIKWNLSASHPNYNYREICEVYAETDSYGLGNGVFPSDAVPISPHPNCMCHWTDVLYEGDELIKRIKEKHNKKSLSINTNDDIIKREIADKLLSDIDLSDRQKLAKSLLLRSGIDVPVNLVPMDGALGNCHVGWYSNGLAKVISLNLKANDTRPYYYQIKTVFHELVHAKIDGGIADWKKISMAKWREIEETVAETVSYYLAKQAGITEFMTPAYGNLLLQNLPRLKQFKEFSKAVYIEDFGKILANYRFGEKNLKWEALYNSIKSIDIDIKEYAKKYETYVMTNKDEIMDIILENINDKNLHSYVKESFERGWKNYNLFESGFAESLIIAMAKLGVK